ncbi:MAG: SRPBCC family protein [Actinomycetota bacterium]
MAESNTGSITDKLPLNTLKESAIDYGKALFKNWLGKRADNIAGLAGRMINPSEGGGVKDKATSGGVKAAVKGKSPVWGAFKGALSGVKDKVKSIFTGGGGKGSNPHKFTNIVEWIEVGVPVTVAYNQWTEFEQWPDFMKKLENAKHSQDDGKVKFKGQVFWSHRSWESTIVEMVPDDRIVWVSTGEKGYLNGSVTFHETAPRLTKICIVVEYHPQGFFEKTGNIWRAVGRRVRVEMKRYVHRVMTHTILNPDDVEGWRGEIRDEEIVRTHDETVEQERADAEAAEQDETGEESEYGSQEEGSPEEGEEVSEEGSDVGYEEYEDGEEPEAGAADIDREPGKEYDEEPVADEGDELGEDEGYEEPEQQTSERK